MHLKLSKTAGKLFIRYRNCSFDLVALNKKFCPINDVLKLLFLCYFLLYALCSKKSDAKIQITITTAYLTRIKYPLSSFITIFPMKMLQISTISTAQFLSNSCFKNGIQKQKFPIWKISIQIDSVFAPLGKQKRQVSAESLLRTRSIFSQNLTWCRSPCRYLELPN